ncbi:MAG: pyridoxal phosphate-dependent aminotransferase, partial [Hyphomicrobiaceae bacterium]
MPAPASAGLRLSQRGAIPPFIVMDVMQAAAEREALGHAVIHMEVGQPGTPAPRAALARV